MDTLNFDRRSLLVLAGGAALMPVAARATPHATGRISDFDFQEGRWHVEHRSLTPATGAWRTFEGEVSMRKVMGGQGNVEDHVYQRDGKTYRAMGLRTFDPATATWSIFWVDSRWPKTIGSPVVGGFTGNRGTFYSQEVVDGRPTLSRFLWTVDDRDHCRWEQGASPDDGATWDANWQMAFRRL